YGNINHDVNVYVKVHRDSPFLVCMDVSLAQSEVIDPNYLWIGPDGQTLKGKSYVNLTETGKLMVHDFREHMSGPYTCTLTYRVFRNDMQVEQEKVKAYKFMVYVNPFAPGWEAICHHVTPDCEDVTNSRVQKARLLIEEFFRRQQYILKDEYENIPVIHYIDHSFQVTRLDSCRPGFGKNDVIHNDCDAGWVLCANSVQEHSEVYYIIWSVSQVCIQEYILEMCIQACRIIQQTSQ
uniref:Zona pellucida binding protein 2 n=1 Tax=Varanus komodoensis TaxID=61221 RepID=A0A8D2LCP8_VARKO